jgi:hypothetical protein
MVTPTPVGLWHSTQMGERMSEYTSVKVAAVPAPPSSSVVDDVVGVPLLLEQAVAKRRNPTVAIFEVRMS